MLNFPPFPKCECEFHAADGEESEVPTGALEDPFLYLPRPIPFTPEMEVVADRYRSHEIDWRYYPAFQAAAFLQPKSAPEHAERKERFLSLQESAESQGFSIPGSLTRLFLTDEYIDRLHHNCVWPSLPEQLVRLPSHPELAVLLFLIEGQGCGIWHLLLAPDGSHTVITADARFGCVSGYPPGRIPDASQFSVFQCMESLNRLLYHYFIHSTLHDASYIERWSQYLAETGVDRSTADGMNESELSSGPQGDQREP